MPGQFGAQAVMAGLPGRGLARRQLVQRDTLGGAMAAAARLPDRAGPELADTARQAFGYGMHVAFAICAVLTLATAVAAATLLRQLRTAEPEFQPGPG